jgi:hypothetical protein
LDRADLLGTYLLKLELAAAAIQERAAAFEENLQPRRRILSASTREDQEEKQNQGRDNSCASHVITLHYDRREFPASLHEAPRVVSIL